LLYSSEIHQEFLKNKTILLMVLFFNLHVPQKDHVSFFEVGPKAVYTEYAVIPRSKLETKITIIVAVSILYY